MKVAWTACLTTKIETVATLTKPLQIFTVFFLYICPVSSRARHAPRDSQCDSIRMTAVHIYKQVWAGLVCMHAYIGELIIMYSLTIIFSYKFKIVNNKEKPSSTGKLNQWWTALHWKRKKDKQEN